MTPHAPRPGRRWPAVVARALIVFALYLGVAVLITRPLIDQFSTQLVGHSFSDTTEYTRHIWRIHDSLRAGRLDYFTTDPLILYPDGAPAGWLWTSPLQSYPQALLLYVVSLPVAHNAVALVTLALNGLAMWALMRWLLQPHPPSPTAGSALNPLHAEEQQPAPAAVGAQRAAPDGPGTNSLAQDVGARYASPLQTTDHAVRSEPAEEDASGRAVARPYSPLPEGEGPGVRANAAPGVRAASAEVPGVRAVAGPGVKAARLELPAFLAGLVFAIYPAFQGQLGAGHTGLLVLWPMPLYILALMTVAETDRPRWRWVALAGLLFAVSLWGSLLLLLYVTLPFTALYGLVLLGKKRWRSLGRVVVVLVVGVLVALPFAWPTLAEASRGDVAAEGNSVRFSASLLTVAAPSFYNPLYSGLTYSRTLLGQDPFEGAGYVGLVAAGLAVIAVITTRRARFWLALALIAWILSLGPLLKVLDTPLSLTADGTPSYVVLPWAFAQNLPFISVARTPARFNFTVGLAMAVLVGFGASALGGWLSRRMSGRAAAAILASVALLIVLDYRWFVSMPTIPAEVPEAVRALGEDETLRAVFDIPWEHPLTDKDALYLQTGHGLPLIAGHITRFTPLDPARGWLLQETLDPALLDDAGADVIILHRQWDSDPEAREGQLTDRFGAPLYADDRIAVWRVVDQPNADPQFLMVDRLTGSFADERSLYFYAPAAGPLTLSFTLASETPRAVSLSLDGEALAAPFSGASFVGTSSFEIPLAAEPGFHTLTLALDPPCPPDPYPTLACAAVDVSDVSLRPS